MTLSVPSANKEHNFPLSFSCCLSCHHALTKSATNACPDRKKSCSHNLTHLRQQWFYDCALAKTSLILAAAPTREQILHLRVRFQPRICMGKLAMLIFCMRVEAQEPFDLKTHHNILGLILYIGWDTTSFDKHVSRKKFTTAYSKPYTPGSLPLAVYILGFVTENHKKTSNPQSKPIN